ncbi:protein of unknown function DUF1793 [Macrophomina phaseolina MS6]|uniref:Six-hairpin glycosidase-like protein n=1 Tax=Macrophomina phaseolina (strain MS6) TaxID=1126212 RepID=K2S654_MACPH|nr:protein of unknown function DUF1793 [Macrophomina phaseolina MS6]
MLAILCIVLATVLSVVLSHETSPGPPGPGHGPGPELPQPPNFSPILPPSYPLAVRNPYLSAWMPGNDALDLPSKQAEFWAGSKLGWTVMASVGDDVYSLFGMPNPPTGVKPANVTGGQYTSTLSSFNLTAGDVNFTLSFLSPVFPGVDDDSLRQQSLPLSFLTVTAEPQSGQPAVRIYSDIGHEWLGNEHGPTDFNLTKSNSGTNYMWSWDREGSDGVYEETKGNMAQWGRVFYASNIQSGVTTTMGFGKRDDIRANFVNTKSLDSLQAAAPQWTGDGIPVSGYSHDLGKVSKSSQVVFGIGMTREKGIRFYGRDETYYYHAKYPKREQLITAVSDAFDALDDTRRACLNLDNKIEQESLRVGGQNYSDITTLSLRQVFGAMDITIPADSLNTSQVNAWMKEISSNGDIQTLDIIEPAAPLFYWLSPGYIRLMLRPVLVYLETGKWPYEWAVHDLGDRAHEHGGYPRAVGHDNGKSEEMPLESTGNLLILAHMYSKASTNSQDVNRFLSDHKPLFTKYANYLKNKGLVPSNQLSTNDGLGPFPNQTNLAIKAAVGLNAYAAMYNNDTLSTAAKEMANKIINKEYGLSSDGTHLTFTYGKDDSWFLMFNLYSDVLLGLNTFPSRIIEMQSNWYQQLQAKILSQGGVGLNIGSPPKADFGTSMWTFHAGASAEGNAKSEVGKMFIDDVHRFISNRRNRVPLCDRWFINGPMAGLASPRPTSFRARPVVGGHFAFLARANMTG